jgi:hypothetical protein
MRLLATTMHRLRNPKKASGQRLASYTQPQYCSENTALFFWNCCCCVCVCLKLCKLYYLHLVSLDFINGGSLQILLGAVLYDHILGLDCYYGKSRR